MSLKKLILEMQCIIFRTLSPVVIFNESRHSLRLRAHVSGKPAQIIKLSLQALRHRLNFELLQSVLCGKHTTIDE